MPDDNVTLCGYNGLYSLFFRYTITAKILLRERFFIHLILFRGYWLHFNIHLIFNAIWIFLLFSGMILLHLWTTSSSILKSLSGQHQKKLTSGEDNGRGHLSQLYKV